VHSFGEWISPHRLKRVQDVFWRPETDLDRGLYRCRSGYRAEFAAGASDDDDYE
jgi:CRISPR-associated protein Csy2